jgi:2-keto-4-pentenoate hydratase
MNTSDVTTAANLLAAARRSDARVGLLPEWCRPQSLAEAHAIQDVVTAVLGLSVGGFKANAPPGAEPTRGVIYAPDIHPSPARVSVARVPQCGVEGEVAFQFRLDLPPRHTPYTREEVATTVDACAAIELVTSRYADPNAAGQLDKLADGISNGAFVHAGGVSGWQRMELGQLKVTLRVNGTPVLEQVGGHPTGDPLGVAVALVEMMRATTGVKAGQFVTCGSCTGLRYLKPGDRCVVHFEGLGETDVTFVT